MNWIQRKIFLYNVTFGLFMLDPWERYLFSKLLLTCLGLDTLMLILAWFVLYNTSRNVNDFLQRHVW